MNVCESEIENDERVGVVRRVVCKKSWRVMREFDEWVPSRESGRVRKKAAALREADIEPVEVEDIIRKVDRPAMKA